MSRTITSLHRYPVKGLSGELLSYVRLQRGCAFPSDRQFAIVHRNSKYDHGHPAWIDRRNFVVLAHSPMLATLKTSYDAQSRVLSVSDDRSSMQIELDTTTANDALDRLLQSLSIEVQPGPYSLAEVDRTALTDSPEPLISLLNTRSLQDLQANTGEIIEPARFRANVWFEGATAWEERSWIGQELSLGGVEVKVVAEIVRCSAIDVHPLTGQRDLPLLARLGGIYGHSHFGVLAEVLQSGRVTVGDIIEEQPPLSFGPLGI